MSQHCEWHNLLLVSEMLDKSTCTVANRSVCRFEAFDEPWKEVFNDAKTGDFWEPHWGLFDVDRNLKKGVKIPDCGGKTLTTPY